MSLHLQAQGNGQMHSAHWYFGFGAGLDFTSGTPVIDTNGQTSQLEGCTAISDEYGNLLFYSDGRKVYDSTHSIMVNGTGLHGDNSSTTSAIVVPKPDDCNLYYIFTIDCRDEEVPFNRPKRGIEYNIVDMTLNGGLGAVVQKNISVPINGIVQGYEKLAAISNADKTGYWMVTHLEGNFYAFEVTTDGVNLTPVVSPSTIYGGSDYIGYLKASHDGSRLSMAFYQAFCGDGALSVYDFNNATGMVSNEIILDYPNEVGTGNERSYYGIEFSPDNQLLYATYNRPICSWNNGNYSHDQINEVFSQYDLNAPSIADSEYIIDDSEEGWNAQALELGLDNKIYRNRGSGSGSVNSKYLAVVEDPNTVYNASTGTAPTYNHQAIDFNPYPNIFTGFGFPTFLNHYFRIAINVNGLSIQEDQLYCTGELLDFDFCHQGGEIQNIHWDFGDGNTSDEFYPQHSYNAPDTYTITLTLMVDGEEYIRTFEIIISGPPEVSNATQEVCLNEGEEHTFILEESLPDINPTNGNYQITFHLTQEEAKNNENPQPTTYTTNQTTTIWVRVEDQQGCFVVRELNLIVYFIPAISIASPVSICSGNSVILQAETEAINTVNWYDSENSSTPIYTGNPFETPTLTQETSYWLEAVSPNGCISERAEVILIIDPEEKPYFDLSKVYCFNSYVPSLPDTSANGISGTWSSEYIDTSVLGTQTYTFTSFPNLCGEVYEVELTIEVIDIRTPEFDIPRVYFFEEDPEGLPAVSNNGISGHWEGSFEGKIKYYTFYPDEGECAEDFKVEIVGYPKFLTPNNDGANDTWSLADVHHKYDELYIKRIYIFDRFGKLLTAFGAYGSWDGTYHGKQMPSNDYWFRIEYTQTLPDGSQQEKIFRKNFTLKR